MADDNGDNSGIEQRHIFINADIVAMTMTEKQPHWLPDISHRPGPRYRAIAAALQDDIGSGALPIGAKLPTHRDLAWRLGVTVGTVTRAYAEAERSGLIGGEVGRGTFVRDPRPTEAPVDNTGIIDLSVNALAQHPNEERLRQALLGLASRNDLSGLMHYPPVNGSARHRQAGAAWIAQTTGLTVDPALVLPTAGGQNAMHLALAAITRPGDSLLVEQLSYPAVKPLAGLLDLRLVPVAMDDGGLLPDALEQAARAHGAHALYCMPRLHNPTTVTQRPDRRQAVMAVCRQAGIRVVEDDVYGFLADDAGPPALVALDPERVLFLTSLSKNLMPGLRTGFLLCPPPLMDRVRTLLRATLLGVNPLGAELSAEFILSGAAMESAIQRRALVADRQAQARRLLPGAASDPACPHLWLPLPEPWRREDFARALLSRGVRVTPADAFAVARGDTPHAVRVCIGGVERVEVLEHGLRILADLLSEPAAMGESFV
ncbi:DNA-binding transcriptional MocR family regulator [Nitrospirillum viridazoti]|uniref:GntR family transcriptional regulator n=2 Tax=Nitrospirillum TaxID=1543705 RepID=A0A248JS11_9PROT|nr:GntR family transcriptional regulator [Nitrospirillum amazonense CBAmc]TWB32479.1 DNA-binding transcriptional MocR family regulator [Nitrospirillum amazonense]